MVSASRLRHRYTYAQYAALERESTTKHEFFDGEIYAMAGGSEDPAALAVSVLAALLAAGRAAVELVHQLAGDRWNLIDYHQT